MLPQSDYVFWMSWFLYYDTVGAKTRRSEYVWLPKLRIIQMVIFKCQWQKLICAPNISLLEKIMNNEKLSTGTHW